MKFSIFSLIALILGLALLIQVVGYVILAINETAIPSDLSQITIANLTGLLGLLVKGDNVKIPAEGRHAGPTEGE